MTSSPLSPSPGEERGRDNERGLRPLSVRTLLFRGSESLTLKNTNNEFSKKRQLLLKLFLLSEEMGFFHFAAFEQRI